MKKLLATLVLASMPALALASGGIVGDCADCHTMHNSQAGAPVALKGLSTTPSATPNQNLLKMDCIACHAQNDTKTVTLPGGSIVPQVYHEDATGDLAGGNFKHIVNGTSRNGHNVKDLFAGGDDNGGTYGAPPGKYYDSVHGSYFGGTATPFANFTCAGSAGCHGTRSQLLTGYTSDNGTPLDTADDYFVYGYHTDGNMSNPASLVSGKRQGIAAVSGAHHNSQDGQKDAAAILAGTGDHDGARVAAGYRFIQGLKGYGNEAARWQNVDATSHNEYFGNPISPELNLQDPAGGCNVCHVPGDPTSGGNSRMTYNSTLRVPNQSMSGFCSTCHGQFHSSATEAGSVGRFASNGKSGAFLRHPSDYVIPNRGEYSAYTTYDISAPVARQTLASAASDVVTPGTDLVMCLSCHKPHASEFAGMLRFDYDVMTAGLYGDQAAAQAEGGCLACHTTKGVLPENR